MANPAPESVQSKDPFTRDRSAAVLKHGGCRREQNVGQRVEGA